MGQGKGWAKGRVKGRGGAANKWGGQRKGSRKEDKPSKWT
jgi:hypothetical protein